MKKLLALILSVTMVLSLLTGITLSASAGKKLKLAGLPAGMATAGLVIGIIATVISGITFFTCGVCGLCLLIEGDQLIDGLNDLANSGNRYGL